MYNLICRKSLRPTERNINLQEIIHEHIYQTAACFNLVKRRSNIAIYQAYGKSADTTGFTVSKDARRQSDIL